MIFNIGVWSIGCNGWHNLCVGISCLNTRTSLWIWKFCCATSVIRSAYISIWPMRIHINTYFNLNIICAECVCVTWSFLDAMPSTIQRHNGAAVAKNWKCYQFEMKYMHHLAPHSHTQHNSSNNNHNKIVT